MTMTLNSDETTIACDIVLIPEDSQLLLAQKCSHSLSNQNSLFTLDNAQFFAHMSLYMFQLNVAALAGYIRALEQLSQDHYIQEFEQNGYHYQDTGFGKGYVDVAYLSNPEADQLQKSVVDVFNPLRAGMREKDKAKMVDASGVKLKNLQQYGYPAIGELFRPHITLTKFPIQIEPNLSPLPSADLFTGRFTKVGLFEMGDNGTCIRKIAEFNLKVSM